MSQGEFLDILVDKLFTKVFTTRAEVYAAQDDLQEIIVPIIGTYPEQWDMVKQALGENAKDNLAKIMASLFKGEDTAVSVIADIVLDTMREAGITEYNSQQVREMVRPLVKLLMKIAASCPDELATLLYNVVGIMSAHYGELGMSWMMTIPADYMTNKQTVSALPFVDVPDGVWYYDDLKYAYDKGLINGTGANTFTPDGEVSRGQAVTVLYRLAGQPSVKGMTCPFTDLKGEWSKDAVIWAYNCGIAKGLSETLFGEDESVTREQLAAFMFRYADTLVCGGSITVPEAYTAPFKDASSVSDYAKDAMLWANGTGIINGKPDGTLDPTGTATRDQFVCMTARFDRLVLA